MCIGIPRLLRVQQTVIVLMMTIVAPFLIVQPAQAAAACGDVVVNEILFKPATPPNDEWVELYVVNALDAGETLKVSDLDTTGGQFGLEFMLTDGVPADRYIVVHGNNYTNSQESTIGFVNVFNAGDGSDLVNSGDNIVLSINGTECEEVHWGSGTPAAGALITLSYGSTGSIDGGESIARSPNGPSGQFVRGTTDGLYNAAEGHSIGRDNIDGALPVTLSWFQSTRAGDSVHFAWQTVTETGNAGFNLLAEAANRTIQLNPTLISSTVIDSVEPTDYSYGATTDAVRFYLQEVGIDGRVDNIGTFSLGHTYGVYTENPDLLPRARGASILFLPFVQSR